MEKLWDSHTMKYYIAIKLSALLPLGTAWVNRMKIMRKEDRHKRVHIVGLDLYKV